MKHYIQQVKQNECFYICITLAILQTIANTIAHHTTIPINFIPILIWSIFFVLQCVFQFAIFMSIAILLKKGIQYLQANPSTSKIGFKKWLCILVPVYALVLLCYYPGGICPDTIYQLQQGTGLMQMNTHHPVINTVLMSHFVQVGYFLGNIELGFFLYNLIQTLYLAIVLAYSLYTLESLDVNKKYIYLVAFIYVTMPNYLGYCATAIKDTPFSTSFLLFMILLFKYTFQQRLSKKEYCLWTFAIISTMAMRNNGIPVIILTAILYIVKSFKSNTWKRTLIQWIIPIVLFVGLNKAYIKHYKAISFDSYASSLSLPLQQTGRYVSKFPNEVTEEEKQILDEVLIYDQLQDAYLPSCSDPIKMIFRHFDCSQEDIKQYFHVYFHQFLNHPGTYFAATFEQNYELFDLSQNDNNYYIATNEVMDSSLYSDIPTIINYSDHTFNNQIEFVKYFKTFDRIPLIRILNNTGFYNLILLLTAAIFHSKHNRIPNVISYLFPLLLSMLVLIASPVLNGAQRYALPIIWVMPFAIGALSAIQNRN